MSSTQHPRGRGLTRFLTATATDATAHDETPQPSTAGSSRGRGRGRARVRSPWEVSDLTASDFQTSHRPPKPAELGTSGTPVTVLANYYLILKFPQHGLVYKYDIEMRNERSSHLSRNDHRLLFELWIRQVCRRHAHIDRAKVVYDNEKIVLTYGQLLPDIDGEGIQEEIEVINRSNRQEKYQISIKQVGQPVDLSELPSLAELDLINPESNVRSDELPNIQQVLSIALHENCSSNADHIYQRSFFTLSQNHGSWDLGLGKAAWQGFYSCLVFANGKNQLLMNLDVKYAVFMKKQPFIEFLCELMLQSPCGRWRYGTAPGIQKAEGSDVLNFLDPVSNAQFYEGEIEFLRKHCNGLRVRSHRANQQQRYRIEGLGLPASAQEFLWKKNNVNRLVTVEAFFQEHHGLTLKYPSLPTLKAKNGAFVPMECVDVEPVRVTRITDEQRAKLCLASSLHPRRYHQAVQQIRENPDQQCFETDPFSQALKIEVSSKMIEVPARILPMPGIQYTASYQIIERQCQQPGVWNSTETHFRTATKFPDVWGLINLSSVWDRKICVEFCGQLAAVAKSRGIECPMPVIYEEYRTSYASLPQLLEALQMLLINNPDCGFLFVILPEDVKLGDKVYGEIKKLSELETGLGIVTQMVKTRSARGQKPGKAPEWKYTVFDNLLQKINTKLGGVNSVVTVEEQIQEFFARGHRIMYVGIDLSHDMLDPNVIRSTVAVVASADDIPNRYFKEIYIQERPKDVRKESIELVIDLKEIMKSLIRQYDQRHQAPPKAIIVFRDGISTSEFHSVFEPELMAIREACVELSPVYRPCLTYIVVNKRHHTRFFQPNLQQNVSAGTVVDSSDVTNPTTYSFFLNSHHAQKGTSRPTYYHVLYDDNRLSPDRMQALTYALCYAYARCTRSISIPAPVKYADLLAFRARFYKNTDESSEAAVPIGTETTVNENPRSRQIVLSPKLLADSPFFL